MFKWCALVPARKMVCKMTLRVPMESCIIRAMRKAKAIKVPTTGMFDFETLIKSKTGKYIDFTAMPSTLSAREWSCRQKV